MYSLAMAQVAAARDICLPAAGGPGRVEGAALASRRPRLRPGLELLEQRPLRRTAIWALSRPLDWLLVNSKKARRRSGGTGAVQAG